MEFLKALRLGRAAELLTRTDLPVKTVASEVGYSSRSSFTRAFVARYGCAPARFRSRPVASSTAVVLEDQRPGLPGADTSSPPTLQSWPRAS